MLKTLHRDLLQPPGRTNRAAFCSALAVIVFSVLLQGVVMRAIGQHIGGFLLGLFWACFNIYMIYSLFARRLHDMSLSVGPLFAALFLTILVIAFTVWAGGGADYFNTLMENPEIANDDAASKALIEAYQADLRANTGWARWVNLIPLGGLSLFCALKAGKIDSNKYGAPPQ